MNFNKYTSKTQDVIQHAASFASANGQQAIETGHLLKAIIDEEPNTSEFLMKKLNVNQALFSSKLGNIVNAYPKVSGGGQPYLANDAAAAFTKAESLLKEFSDEFVSIELL